MMILLVGCAYSFQNKYDISAISFCDFIVWSENNLYLRVVQYELRWFVWPYNFSLNCFRAALVLYHDRNEVNRFDFAPFTCK